VPVEEVGGAGSVASTMRRLSQQESIRPTLAQQRYRDHPSAASSVHDHRTLPELGKQDLFTELRKASPSLMFVIGKLPICA
jgi:hypothetical protein